MRIQLWCSECETFGGTEKAVALPFDEAGLYKFTCAVGHRNEVALHEHRFEVLAEVALQAIIDGYYREAVSSFASSLERFYEYFVEVVMRHRFGESSPFPEGWKRLSKQSERQLGAYLGIYMLEKSAPGPTLSDEYTNFRNKVVHQGFIPNEAEAMRFGQAVINVVQPLIGELRTSYDAAMTQTRFSHLRKTWTGAEEKTWKSVTSHPMVYRVNRPPYAEPFSLEDLVAARRAGRRGLD